MKLKTTKKEIQKQSWEVWAVGYCEAQYLLRALEPFAYSIGIYGWSCDYYDLGHGLKLSTGYSPIGKRLPYDLVRKYESRAAKIWGDYDKYKNYETRKKAVQKLLAQFIAAVRDHFDKNPLN